jgi:hypothetical protein
VSTDVEDAAPDPLPAPLPVTPPPDEASAGFPTAEALDVSPLAPESSELLEQPAARPTASPPARNPRLLIK